MQGFPAKRRIVAALATGLVAGLLSSPAAADGEHERALREASRPGAFCTASSCRPHATSGWTTAAFGAVVVAMGWQARRREDTGLRSDA